MEQLKPTFKHLEKEIDNILEESTIEEEEQIEYLKNSLFAVFKQHVGTLCVVSPPIAQVPVNEHDKLKTTMMLKLFDAIEQIVKDPNQKLYQTVKDHEGTKFGLSLSIYQKEKFEK